MKCLKKIISFFIFLISISSIISCNFSNKLGVRNQNIWIGSYTDLVFKLPNPKIYTSDSIYIISDSIKIKKINDSDQLSFISDSISKTIIHSGSDSMQMFYLKARETNFKIGLEDLFKSNWETNEHEENESLKKRKIYSFRKDNKLFIQTNYVFNNEQIYSEIEEYRFKLIHINQTYIIQILNNSKYSYFGQIISKNRDSFKIEFLNNIRPNIVKFETTEQKIIPSENLYNICFQYLIPQYFNGDSGTKYNGGLRKIKTIFKEKYSYKTTKTNQNGYIRIRFIVNCDGKIGRFSLMELDENYLPFSFDSEIVSSIFNITTTELKNGWIARTFGQNDSTTSDSYKHLTFKIKEGKITDILP